jgi:protein-S-isoprenylcysteine O-methyltransferase Ste14
MARRHSHREDLSGEHKAGDAGQAIMACLFFSVWILDTFFLKYTTFLNGYVPFSVRIPIGVIFLVLSLILVKKGLSIVFGEERETPGVIRKGVFNIVRHPVYLSELLLYLGFILMSISVASILVWVAAFLFLHFISRYEEKLLLERFGEEYERYIKEVPMWFPRLLKK